MSMETTENAGEFSEQNPARTKREVAIYGDFLRRGYKWKGAPYTERPGGPQGPASELDLSSSG